MAQVEANSLHVAVFERVLVDRDTALAEVPRRIDVGAAMIRHREEHHAVAVHISGVDERFLMRLPDAVNDRRLTRISGRAVIELPAQVDHSHGLFLPPFEVRSCRRRRASYRKTGDNAPPLALRSFPRKRQSRSPHERRRYAGAPDFADAHPGSDSGFPLSRGRTE